MCVNVIETHLNKSSSSEKGGTKRIMGIHRQIAILLSSVNCETTHVSGLIVILITLNW